MQRQGSAERRGAAAWAGAERACRGVRAARTICQWQIVRRERPACKRRAGWQARPVSLWRDGEGEGEG
jgi:hypothetical protein